MPAVTSEAAFVESSEDHLLSHGWLRRNVRPGARPRRHRTGGVLAGSYDEIRDEDAS